MVIDDFGVMARHLCAAAGEPGAVEERLNHAFAAYALGKASKFERQQLDIALRGGQLDGEAVIL